MSESGNHNCEYGHEEWETAKYEHALFALCVEHETQARPVPSRKLLANGKEISGERSWALHRSAVADLQSGTLPSGNFVAIDDAFFHHEDHILSRFDVGERVSPHRNDIGKKTGLQDTDLIHQAEKFSR